MISEIPNWETIRMLFTSIKNNCYAYCAIHVIYISKYVITEMQMMFSFELAEYKSLRIAVTFCTKRTNREFTAKATSLRSHTYLHLMIFLIQFCPRKFGTYSVECWKLSNLRNTAKISHFYAHCRHTMLKRPTDIILSQNTVYLNRYKVHFRIHHSERKLFKNKSQMEFWQFHNAKVVCSSFWLYEKKRYSENDRKKGAFIFFMEFLFMVR